MVQIHSKHDPRGCARATIGKAIFTCVFIGKSLFKIISQTTQAISIKLGTNHP
jgi:hypothetical protein